MAKKRPTLDAFLNLQTEAEREQQSPASLPSKSKSGKSDSARKTAGKDTSSANAGSASKSGKHDIIRHMLYLPLPVYDQLQGLIFEEQRGQAKRRKTHDYLLDAIDLLFKEKGLKSIAQLTSNKNQMSSDKN